MPHFSSLLPTTGYRVSLAVLVVLTLLGGGAAWLLAVHGHQITAMTNQVVWGVPHVFALTLILAASGAFNVAALWSVFRRPVYRPLGRLSAVVAVALLGGGVLILVLDLGRPDRLIIALTERNLHSVFAWNVWLYLGFVVVAVAYLWALFEPRLPRVVAPIGILALVWRLALTCGSGAIFAVLVARPAVGGVLVVPLFIALSLSLGGAGFVLIVLTLSRWHAGLAANAAPALPGLARLLAAFVGAVLLLTALTHATMYASGGRGAARFMTGGAGFWVLQIGVGAVLPLLLLTRRRARIGAAAALLLVGGAAQVYGIIIGAQAYPRDLFPGRRVVGGVDGVIAEYAPSAPEILLGVGGLAVALLGLLLALRVLPFLPDHPPSPPPRR